MRISAILLVVFGRVDDGSGVTPTMEAARLIMEAGGRPKRTILAILWAGGEFGLYGSASLVERHEAELETISKMVNRDGGPEVPTVGIDLGDPKGCYIQKEAEEK